MIAHDTTSQPRAVVIGGGLAGLSAAIHLASTSDAAVTVYERASALGGRGQTQVEDGFAFNLGPHAVYPGALQLLAELGIDPPGGIPNANGFVIHRGRLHLAPASAGSLLRTRLLGLRDKLEVARLLTTVPKADPGTFASMTVADWLAATSRRLAVRDLLATFLRVASYTNAPDVQSAGAALAALQPALAGVRYVDGGWATIVDALHNRATELGVAIVTASRVSRIAIEGRRVRGVEFADGSYEPADAVVATGSPDDMRQLLPSGSVPAVERVAAGAIPARIATLDIGLSRLPRPERRVAFGVGKPLYFSVHSATARLAPEGSAMIHVAKYLAPGHRNPRADRAELEAVLDLVQPGWRDFVVRQRFLPDLVAINAIVTARDGGLEGRPPADFAGIEGLTVAGDWVGPHGQLAEASLASAGQAAALARDAILRSEPVPGGRR